ncbi:MAG: GTP-binding protein Obg/CgtA [Thermomicrobiales bacterium]|nr:GTP-binding protein Obg/CgtA [Thermomicrobiales bacterium]
MLIDRARIWVKAGDGGNGSASFRREKYVPRGGPDGGDGGRGGTVYLRAKSNLTSLLPFQFTTRFKAENGGPGRSQQRHGKNGKDVFVDVPVGTVVWDDESGEILADLTEDDERTAVARGGRGGLGNVHFKTSTRQAPRLAELGEPGEERWLRLELRMIADVGLVGLPNAGKSTLLAASSAARPKIADYPFTTLEPILGVVQVGGIDGQIFVMADIPGLIGGAAQGVGLGLEFLRHVRRTKVLVHVLDASGGLEGRDPLQDFETVNAELNAYEEDLLAKPMLVALNKTDIPEARQRLESLTTELQNRGFTVFSISAVTGEGVPELLRAVAAVLREVQQQEAVTEKPQDRRRYTLENVDERAWSADRLSRHHFVVTGIGIERFTRMTDFSRDEAVERFQRLLESSGISIELGRLGIESGDVVHIADIELVWGDQEELQPLESNSRRKGSRHTTTADS